MDNMLAPLLSPTKRPQRSSYGGASAAPEATWTASRCSRLLRPVESRLILLRKQRKNGGLHDGAGLASVVESKPSLSGATQVTQDSVVDMLVPASKRHSHRDDPDWVPGSGMRKKVKYRYSGRGNEGGKQLAGASQAVHATVQPADALPDKLTVATPSLIKYREVGGGENEHGQPSTNDEARPETVCKLRRPGLPHCGNLSSQYPAVVLHFLQKQSRNPSLALVEGVVQGFISLLKATANPLPGNRSGPRSLLSTCLRKVPSYIAEEQTLQKEDCEDSQADVSSEVYAYLEDYGAFQGHGWAHLAEVVRAHGVALLGDAINEGLLNHCAARALIQICIHHLAYDEAEVLVSCLVSIQMRSHRPGAGLVDSEDVDHRIRIGLIMLQKFAQQTGRHGFQYRLIESLLLAECLPLKFLATPEFTKSWGHIIQSISNVDKDSKDALGLLCTATTLACGSSVTVLGNSIHELRLSLTDNSSKNRGKLRTRNSRLYGQLVKHKDREPNPENRTDSQTVTTISKTVSRLLTILSATALYRMNSDRASDCKMELHYLEIRAIADLALTVRGVSELKPVLCAVSAQSEETIALVLMAKNVLPAILPVRTSMINSSGGDMKALLSSGVGFSKSFTATSDLLYVLATFVSSVGCCAGRISQNSGFDYIQILSRYLIDMVKSGSGTIHLSSLERQAFAYIGSKAALVYAKGAPSAAHFEFAEHIRQVARRHGLDEDDLSGRCKVNPTHFRWEEGISEWVAATPAAKKRKFSALDLSSSTHSSDTDDCASITERDSPDTDISSPETSVDQDDLHQLPRATNEVHIKSKTLAQGLDTNLHHTSRRPFRRGLAISSHHISGARGTRQLARHDAEIESEDELSFT